jgi:hypothetical protein
MMRKLKQEKDRYKDIYIYDEKRGRERERWDECDS